MQLLLPVLLAEAERRAGALGAGLGGGGEVNTTRRGTDKTIFQLTIVSALVFSVSLVLGITVS